MTIALLVLALATSIASAQDVDRETAAREAFDRAVAAMQEGRTREGVELFRRSLELMPRTESAFNLAVALRGVGDHVAARATLDALAAGTYGALGEEELHAVEALRDEIARETPSLRIEVDAADASVSIDGTEIDGDARALTVALNPGAHEVVARAPRHRESAHTIELALGESEALAIALEPIVDVAPARAREPLDDTDDGTVFESPWFWIVGALLVGGGVAAVVLLVSLEPSGTEDRVWGRTLVLRGP
jgi:hypothetical protein